jgi:hypothetical protein
MRIDLNNVKVSFLLSYIYIYILFLHAKLEEIIFTASKIYRGHDRDRF